MFRMSEVALSLKELIAIMVKSDKSLFIFYIFIIFISLYLFQIFIRVR